VTWADVEGLIVLRRRSEMTPPGRRPRLQQAGAGCNLLPLSRAKAGDDLEIPIMRKWKKPTIIEVTVGCEVTSYAPAKL
jgi:coenzyme PQQ precursor peptide PqqA